MQGHIHRRVHTTHDGRTTTTWYVVVDAGRDRSGRRRQKWHGGFRTRRAAEAARAKIVNDITQGLYVPPTGLTLLAWIEDQWLPLMKTQVKPSTWDSYSRNMRLHVLPRIGHRVLQQVNATMLNELYAALLADGNARGGGLSPKTVRYIHAMVHKALSDAMDAGVVNANAAERARPPKLGKSRIAEMRSWLPGELRTFLDIIEGTRLQAAWHVAALTGMRRGEVLGLRWRDVDMEHARLSVRHTIVSVAYEVRSSTPKTHQARVIDLDAGTIEQLRAHHQRQAAERAEWKDDYGDRELVFCRENGSPIHPDSFSQSFERIVARSKLPRIRLHDLRHTHATIALRAGVPVKVISERLGHESPAFTMKQYAHVLPGMQAEAASRIAGLVTGA